MNHDDQLGNCCGYSCAFLADRQIFIAFGKRNRQFSLPVDTIILKGIEIFNAIPRLILIIIIAALAAPGIGMVILVIGLTYWTGIARLTRAEILRTRTSDYVEASRGTGIHQPGDHLAPCAAELVGPAVVAMPSRWPMPSW